MKQELLSKIQAFHELKRLINPYGFIAKPVMPNRKKVAIEYTETSHTITPDCFKNFVSIEIIDQIRNMIPILIKEYVVFLDIIPTFEKHTTVKIVAFNSVYFDKVKYSQFNTLDVLLMIKECLPELTSTSMYLESNNVLMLVPFFAINDGGVNNVNHRCNRIQQSYHASSISLQLITEDTDGFDCEKDYYLLTYLNNECEFGNISCLDVVSRN